jgi:hypothetical protein
MSEIRSRSFSPDGLDNYDKIFRGRGGKKKPKSTAPMTIPEAVARAGIGLAIRRRSWPANVRLLASGTGFFCRQVSRPSGPHLFSQNDLVATDWEVVKR